MLRYIRLKMSSMKLISFHVFMESSLAEKPYLIRVKILKVFEFLEYGAWLTELNKNDCHACNNRGVSFITSGLSRISNISLLRKLLLCTRTNTNANLLRSINYQIWQPSNVVRAHKIVITIS